jgi:ribosomal protein S18 acetylase RimI-like enzyme
MKIETTTRPITRQDVLALAELMNASAWDRHNAFATNEARLQAWLDRVSPDELAKDTQLVFTATGELVGFAYQQTEPPFVTHELMAFVQPDYRGRGIGSQLLAWAMGNAASKLHLAPDGARVVVHSPLFDTAVAAQNLLLRHGFQKVRQFIHLQIHMDSPPEPPKLLDGITIERVTKENWPGVIAALEEAFKDHWGHIEWDEPEEEEEEEVAEATAVDHWSLDKAEEKAYFNTPGLCFAALADGNVVGSCLCNANTVEIPQAGKLGSLSILPAWRQRGIGQALTQHALTEFYRQGITHVITDTDAASFTSAYNIYLKAGMEIFQRENVFEKEIRPGKDLLKRDP